MQIASAGNSNLANIPVSLQSTRSRSGTGRNVDPVGPRTESEPYLAQPTPNSKVDLDPSTEKRLDRIKEVQVAFKAALGVTDFIQNEYLLDPIL